MIVFPIGTDRRLKSTPWLNYALIGLNIFIFLFTEAQIRESQQASEPLGQAYAQVQIAEAQLNEAIHSGNPVLIRQHERILQRSREQLRQVRTAYERAFPVVKLYLYPEDPKLYQFFTSMFLHAGKLHLASNMLFLYVFGNGVEDRFGKLGYLMYYLAAGVVAGLGHCLVDSSPVLGASGAIAGVTGMFLALFPMSYVTIFYWFFYIGRFEVTSMLFILFYMVWDFGLMLMGVGNTAYVAHLSGYAFGFGVGMALLLVRILPREPYDMLALIEQRRRRAEFRKLSQQGYRPWQHNKPGDPPGKHEAAQVSPQEERMMQQRSEISASLSKHDLNKATHLYMKLLEEDPNQVMGQQQQLDLANQLMADQKYQTAAAAYELFLKTYPHYSDRQHVQLIDRKSVV